MIRLYTNRELSEKLGINLAKWKRWSREFLPPDPLGGMQSGFSRQYYFSDAFHVMLGGHLVGNLYFSFYEARRIIEDLKDWLTEKGFYHYSEQLTGEQLSGFNIQKYRIYIQQDFKPEKKQIDFVYHIRGILAIKPVRYNGKDVREELYEETVIRATSNELIDDTFTYYKILDISVLYKFFIGKLGYKENS